MFVVVFCLLFCTRGRSVHSPVCVISCSW